MTKLEQPVIILPKKRNHKKNNGTKTHVDHIIKIQGVDEKSTKYKNVLSPSITEHVVNGTIHSTMEGLKSNMKIDLPIITDVQEHDEDTSDKETEPLTSQPVQKKGFTSLHNSREIIDLSPIYENSSDACSSHDDLRDNDFNKTGRVLNSDNNESSTATPNSMSQSEASLEMGPITDSLKNSTKRKKRVNINTDIIEAENTEMIALRKSSESSNECSIVDNSGYLTMTGTIKRGKKKGQNVDVKLNISREELEIIEAAIVAEENNKIDISKCALQNGPHILVFTLLCLPFVAVISSAYSFYLGTLTWYNIFNHVTEDLSLIKKIVLSPIVIMSYPFLIVIFTLGIGLYASIIQITFSIKNWHKEVCDYEKGFYGWFCSMLGVSEYCPYEVVILTEVKPS